MRRDVGTHDTGMGTFVDRVGGQLSGIPGTDYAWVRPQVAYSLVRRCIGRGGEFRLEISPNRRGYSYQTGTGGGGSNSAGSPSVDLVAGADAFRDFQKDADFVETCERITERAAEIQMTLLSLSQEASMLAEVTTLDGDCRYLVE